MKNTSTVLSQKAILLQGTTTQGIGDIRNSNATKVAYLTNRKRPKETDKLELQITHFLRQNPDFTTESRNEYEETLMIGDLRSLANLIYDTLRIISYEKIEANRLESLKKTAEIIRSNKPLLDILVKYKLLSHNFRRKEITLYGRNINGSENTILKYCKIPTVTIGK